MGVISLVFFLFLFITFSLYWIIPCKYRKHFLLAASLLFCVSYWKYETFFILAYLTVVFYLSKTKNRNIIILDVVFILVPLFYTKYYGFLKNLFFVSSETSNFSFIGISFVSFRCISYAIDCYQNKIRDISFPDYLLYILFFPCYISGPIEKADSFLLNIDESRKINWNSFVEAIIITIYGLLIKLVLADRLGKLITILYDGYQMYTQYCLIAVFAYPVYIYCDFAGYSYMALGIGKLFGYNVTENFMQPYFSLSIKEFWNRWHISLNEWFKNYLYIPLGGNRKGRIRKYLNILIVFTISGIWHGAGLGFIIWGSLNGLYQIIGDITSSFREKLYEKTKLNNTLIQKCIKLVITFLLITFSWIFFSQGTRSFAILSSLFSGRKLSIAEFMVDANEKAGSSKGEILMLVFYLTVVVIVDFIEHKGKRLSSVISNKGLLIRCLVVLFLLFSVLTFGKYGKGYDPNDFVYFGF